MIHDIPTLIKEAEEEKDTQKFGILRGWVKIEHFLPNYDQDVLWYMNSGNYFVECLDKDGNPWLESTTSNGARVTHWMLLPKGPEEK